MQSLASGTRLLVEGWGSCGRAAFGRLRRMASVVQGTQALVTRPQEEAQTLAAALETRGIGAVIEPLMQMRFLAPSALDLAGVQAILCTSANGVRALARVSGERGLPVLAVGDATAARARAEGFAAVESAGGDVTDLVRLAAARLHPGNGRLLHVAGNIVAGDLVGALRAHGFSVERSVLYEALPATALSPMAVHALRFGTVVFALFYSPRTAAVFARLAAIAYVAECCRAITALSISAPADAALAELPWQDRRVAERPDQPALLDMLDRVLAERSRASTGNHQDVGRA
jgi:uroporphyrinogen-III synthase